MRRLLPALPMAGLILGLSAVLTLFVTQPTTGVRTGTGEVAKQTYKSPRTVTYKSDLKTAEAERNAADQVPTTYRRDLTAASQQDGKVTATFAAVSALRSDPAPINERAERLGQVVPNLNVEQARALLGLDDGSWQRVQETTTGALHALQNTQIKQEDLSRADQLVSSQLPQNLPPAIRSNSLTLGTRLLIPNYLTDEETTEAAKSKAKGVVEPVSYTIERDQVIAYRGQVLSDFDVERLAAVGLTRPAFDWQKSLGVLILVLIGTVLLLGVAPRFATRLPRPKRTLALLAGFAVAVVLVGVLVVPAQPILAYVAPVAAAALLLAIFYGLTTALIAGVSLDALFAISAGGSFELFFIHLAATIAVAVFASRVTSTKGFIASGAVGGLTVFVAMSAFSLLAANFDLANLPKFGLAAALNGALLATFGFAGAAFLGGPLGTLTFLQLLELESPRQPLLRRLAGEAPGTYSHSLRMAALVEAVAARVGADPLLARVMALYHDIGKLAAPEFFTENRGGGATALTDQPPREAAELLRSHISEGLGLAREAGVPDEVTAVIPEHHGTSRMDSIWDLAQSRYRRPREADYRYLGPVPQSKETAIVMMADAVEAASRSIDSPDERKIRDLVRSIFNARITGGQLDDAPLTAQELTVMQRTFTERILADRHRRIKYPDARRARGRKR